MSALPRSVEVLVGAHPDEQGLLELATEGIVRYVWQSAFGPMLIEVRDGSVFVNGSRVPPISELRIDEA